MRGWGVTITDPAGHPINTVTCMDVHLHASAEDTIWAECQMFADEDGQPILDGREPRQIFHEDGTPGIAVGTFAFRVQEMRVAAP
jgi:hypothetical protein